MNYKSENWTIARLYEVIKSDQLILNPPYQRNAVWSAKAQKKLIETIRMGLPIPNFFFREIEGGRLEVVDGQQRARSILGFKDGYIECKEGKDYGDLSVGERQLFDQYELSITIISDLNEQESIESYFALVNSTGLRVNRPEVFNAKYHDTRFLKLITEMANIPCFYDLRLFTASKQNRMEDLDFVSELLALLHVGITDKKEAVDKMFASDISNAVYDPLANKFKAVIQHIVRLNSITSLYRTRYRQKNDFYTLFHFIHENLTREPEDLDYYYELLIKIAPYISPSQQDCDPLKYYAINCVTQSNSKNARQARYAFFEELFLNPKTKPNALQVELMHFFKMSESDFAIKGGFLTLDMNKVHDPYNFELQI